MTPQACIRFSLPLRGISLAEPDVPLTTETPHVPAEEPRADSQNEADEERRQLDALLGGFSQLVEELKEQRKPVAELQRIAVELAVAIASRIVHQKLSSDDFAVEQMVREVVGRLGTEEPVTVRLHPDDLALLGRRLGGEEPLVAGNVNVQLVADQSLGRGGCLAEAGEVGLLAQPDLQLTQLREMLLGTLTDAQFERRKAQPEGRNLRRFPDRRQTA